MSEPNIQPFVLKYALAMEEYLGRGGNEALERARELGRLAGSCSITPHQVVAIHATALGDLAPQESASHFEFLTHALVGMEQRPVAAASPSAECVRSFEVQDILGTDALINKSIAADTRRRRQVLADLSRRILTSGDPKAAICTLVGDVVPDVADCSAAHWMGAAGDLTLEATGSPGRDLMPPLCKRSNCRDLARQVLTSCKVTVVEPTSGDSGFRQSVLVPLVANGQLLGTLTLCQASESREIGFVREFGEQLACCTQRAFESVQYREIAQNSYEFLDEYLNRAVHDLSSPLATLSLVLEIGLKRLERGDALNEATVRKALAQVEQMTALLKELLDATQKTLSTSMLPPGTKPSVPPGCA